MTEEAVLNRYTSGVLLCDQQLDVKVKQNQRLVISSKTALVFTMY
jgi:hypothetical protein